MLMGLCAQYKKKLISTILIQTIYSRWFYSSKTPVFSLLVRLAGLEWIETCHPQCLRMTISRKKRKWRKTRAWLSILFDIPFCFMYSMHLCVFDVSCFFPSFLIIVSLCALFHALKHFHLLINRWIIFAVISLSIVHLNPHLSRFSIAQIFTFIFCSFLLHPSYANDFLLCYAIWLLFLLWLSVILLSEAFSTYPEFKIHVLVLLAYSLFPS